jgi:hypothetical protein
MAHQLIDHPGRDAGVLQPGREGVPEIMNAAEIDHVQQRVSGREEWRPAAPKPFPIGRGQAHRCELTEGGLDSGGSDGSALAG